MVCRDGHRDSGGAILASGDEGLGEGGSVPTLLEVGLWSSLVRGVGGRCVAGQAARTRAGIGVRKCNKVRSSDVSAR